MLQDADLLAVCQDSIACPIGEDVAALFATLANGNPQCDDWRKPFVALALAYTTNPSAHDVEEAKRTVLGAFAILPKVVLTTCEPRAYGFHQPHPNRIIYNCIFLSISVHEAYLYCRSLSIFASALLQPAVAEPFAAKALHAAAHWFVFTVRFIRTHVFTAHRRCRLTHCATPRGRRHLASTPPKTVATQQRKL
jgi:hypothetical protein